MKHLQNTPHLDPLPSSDEGRGNPAVSVKRTPLCVCERSARFPLPFGRGEDQGEGLLWETLVSLAKWMCTPALSHRMGEGELSSTGRHIQPLWKLQQMGLAAPSPVERERVRVKVVFFEIRLLSGNCYCTNHERLEAIRTTV